METNPSQKGASVELGENKYPRWIARCKKSTANRAFCVQHFPPRSIPESSENGLSNPREHRQLQRMMVDNWESTQSRSLAEMRAPPFLLPLSGQQNTFWPSRDVHVSNPKIMAQTPAFASRPGGLVGRNQACETRWNLESRQNSQNNSLTTTQASHVQPWGVSYVRKRTPGAPVWTPLLEAFWCNQLLLERRPEDLLDVLTPKLGCCRSRSKKLFFLEAKRKYSGIPEKTKEENKYPTQ